MRPGRAADHSPPSSAAVMEEHSYTSTHPLGNTGPVTGSLYFTRFRWRLSQPQGHSAAGSDSIGNRTRDLPTCSAVPQPNAPPRAPKTTNVRSTISVFLPDTHLLFSSVRA